jgi:hypothetical protein
MFQLFLRARVNHYFKARSAGRDAETDHARAASVFRSIENALDGAKYYAVIRSKSVHTGLLDKHWTVGGWWRLSN